MGEVLAKKSKTTAYVVMLKEKSITNSWKNYEYSSLVENDVKIIAVNAENFNDTKELCT